MRKCGRGLSMNRPGHRIADCLGKAALKTHALQTLRDCLASPNRAKSLECVRFYPVLAGREGARGDQLAEYGRQSPPVAHAVLGRVRHPRGEGKKGDTAAVTPLSRRDALRAGAKERYKAVDEDFVVKI
jgi:hypothetical protein